VVPEQGQARADGREALRRYDWQRAYDELSIAGAATSSDPETLDAFAEAAWWLGKLDECVAARKRAYERYEAAGDHPHAVRVAARLFDDHCFKGRHAVAQAWVRRAARLLGTERQCSERGQLLLRDVEVLTAGGHLDGAYRNAEQALELGRACSDADLQADSLQALGRILILRGQPADGLALLDEAMLPAVEGKLGPFVTGKVYCSLMSACEELGDLERAGEWTELGMTWSLGHPFAAFPGLCRVHRAEVLQLRGAWADAEQEARRACDELADVNLGNAARAWYEIGEIRRRLGDLDEAEHAFARAAELGVHPQPGLALLRLSQNRPDAAAAGITQALSEESWNRLARAKLLGPQVQIALATGALDVARAAADELEAIAGEYGSAGLRAASASARGRLKLAEGDVSAACSTLRRALTSWQDLDVPYEVATTQVLLGSASRDAGDEDSAVACFRAAAEGFDRLGASIDARELEARRRGVVVTAGGLTNRECEVLRLVASGASNKEIAVQLVVSKKTIDRHLSNIFTKIGVSSRTAAAAYAFENGIVSAHA